MVYSAGLIVNTALPVLPSYLLRRPSLVKKCKQGMDAPVLLLHAPMGYGKTTAIASFLKDHKMDSCWIRFSAKEMDEQSVWQKLFLSMRQLFPHFGETWMDEIFTSKNGDPPSSTFLEKWISEWLKLSKNIVFVLDNYHVVQSIPGVRPFMEEWVKNIPAGCHLVIMSREKCDWGGLHAMKMKGELYEISTLDLAWSEEEIEVYFTDYYQHTLSQEQLQLIFRRTRGWPVAVRLLAQYFSREIGTESLFQDHSDFMQDLFRYFKEEVWQGLSCIWQKVLLEMSLLDMVSDQTYTEAYERKPMISMNEVEQRHLFVTKRNESSYFFHPLFQRFLQYQLKQNAIEQQRLYPQAIQYYSQSQKYEQALHYAREWGDRQTFAEMLLQCAKEWLNQGQLDRVEASLCPLEDDWKDHYYHLWIYEGELYRYRCQYEKALQCYTRVEKLAKMVGDRQGESLSLEGQARVYLDTIQPGKAEYFLLRALQVLEGEEAYHSDRERLQLLIAENQVNIGRVWDANQWLEKRKEGNEVFVDPELEARLLLRTGRLRQARQILEKKKKEEEQAGKNLLPRSHRETHVLLSFIQSLIGEIDQAKKMAEIGIVQGVEYQSPFIEACGWMRLGHAVQLMPKYEKKLAVECYQAAIELMDDLRMSRGKAEPLLGMTLLYGRDGVTDLACYYGQQALTEVEKVKDHWLAAVIRLAMGIAAFYGERLPMAEQIFTECCNRFVRCGDHYFLTVSLLWKAITALDTGDESVFAGSMRELLSSMQKGQYEFLLQKRTLFGPRDIQRWIQLLFTAQGREIEESYVSYLLEEMGLHHVTSHPGYTLRIQTLGTFRVWLGDDEIQAKDWQRSKAKELFQFLITKRHSLLTKEEICAYLWPDADMKAADRDFKVALHALNNTLEPNRSARSTSFYIQRQGALYGLNRSAGYELDVDEFEKLVQQGMKEEDLNQLQSGLDLYHGSYLPERRYEDWSAMERERLQSLFIRGAERLARLLIEQQMWDEAIDWCERILQEDPCWEEAYRLLMKIYYLRNNRPQSIRIYQRCCNRLQKELGITPMPKTEEWYQFIVQGRLPV
ncbi:BTAD domain-containing putative transcriptional regulator [Thermoflavimicrobium dichotomicum]|uniref:Transcriptional activator domain-containing protein n=1 Tax=Thermoflavimicrobium dichotomicum TaxID=46223 RepID=A0A1I3S1Z6_9BACL|nr:BTAD domain-containing putative transcriptional regulator [Thermoflavimicrobium dichotomicum]SFJ51561.1 transcriptional activator domain-containing protein [Thermoflavimicrobium dichotomicum]